MPFAVYLISFHCVFVCVSVYDTGMTTMAEIGLHSTSLLYNSGFNLLMCVGLSFLCKSIFFNCCS